MRVGSLFSGIGGLELGLERAGMEVVYQAEYDKQARRVLARHWPDVHRYEDVHDVSGSTCDVLCGGFPCQDYSVAGKRGGLAGDRGALWWEMHRIVSEQRPSWVVGENVPGLLSSNGGADFRTIIASLVQLGYGVCWATLDSQFFGVAQRRRRLFIVGHSGGEPRPEVLALSEGLFGHPAPSRETGSGVAEGVRGGVTTYRYQNVNKPLVEDSVSATLKAESGTKVGSGIGMTGTAAVVAFNGNVTPKTERVASAGSEADFVVCEPPIAFDTTQITSALNRSHPKPGDPCHPIAAGAHPPAVTTAVPRRLTPGECERLQGFPDGWTRYYADGTEVADGPRYRMLGNAVTVNVAEWIGRRIVEHG